MSMRAIIVEFHESTGRYNASYVHNDGDRLGETLLNNYTDPAKVKELFALGDLSILAEEIGVKHDPDWRIGLDRAQRMAHPNYWMCCAHHRDMNRTFHSESGTDLYQLADNRDAEYVYQWHYGTWVCYEVEKGKLVHFDPLAETV